MKKQPQRMTFKEALRILNIEDYSERIFNSNSHGELFFLADYIQIAEHFKGDSKWFRPWFIAVVEEANKTWIRPQSVYQHIIEILNQHSRLKQGVKT